jgi:ketosteroid isomerase-like protein
LFPILSEKRAVSIRSLLVCGVLFLLASPLFGADAYYRTRDKRTLVWMHNFKPGDEASWSGHRDATGYATGTGTLTWYKVDWTMLTGSNLPVRKPHPIRRYSGRMVRGKLQGQVNVQVDGETYHARFDDGARVSDWVAGSAPVHRKPVKHVPETAMAQKATPTPSPMPTPSPSPEEKPTLVIPERTLPEAPVPKSESLRSLAIPPSTLQTRPGEGSSSPSPQPTPSASDAGPAPMSDDAQTVAALDTLYQAAVKANDAEVMDRILADDFVLMTGRGRSATKADLIKEAREKETIYEHQEEERGTQKVRVWGDTAIVTARLWIKGTRRGKPIDYKLWFSDTYRRTPDGWRYVFGQASLPQPSTEPK